MTSDRTITLIPVQPCDSSGAITAQFLLTASPNRAAAAPTTSDPQTGNGRPRRTGSLALFFRKVGSIQIVWFNNINTSQPLLQLMEFSYIWLFVLCVCSQVYHLASVRLRDLCVKLDISSELRGTIWTCFEHALVHCTDLMRGRHLDQLLLCSVYIISKVRKLV